MQFISWLVAVILSYFHCSFQPVLPIFWVDDRGLENVMGMYYISDLLEISVF
jgi:hypothetical protein